MISHKLTIAFIFLILAIICVALAGEAGEDFLNKKVSHVFQNNPSVLVKTKDSSEIINKANDIHLTYHIPVLMYHYVENIVDTKDKTRVLLNTSPETLDEQIKSLFNAGYNFITMKEASSLIDANKPLSKKYVVLTFDDGYEDFYTDVYPILLKHHIKSTAYIISDFIGKPNYMDEPQIKELLRSGFVEIGSHTVHHVFLPDASQNEAINEIETSKKDLESMFGIHIVSFAYPYGGYDERSKQIVKNTGYANAVSTSLGKRMDIENRFEIPRIRPGRNFGSELINYLNNVK